MWGSLFHIGQFPEIWVRPNRKSKAVGVCSFHTWLPAAPPGRDGRGALGWGGGARCHPGRFCPPAQRPPWDCRLEDGASATAAFWGAAVPTCCFFSSDVWGPQLRVRRAYSHRTFMVLSVTWVWCSNRKPPEQPALRNESAWEQPSPAPGGLERRHWHLQFVTQLKLFTLLGPTLQTGECGLF